MTRVSTAVLAVMIGSISLTLSSRSSATSTPGRSGRCWWGTRRRRFSRSASRGVGVPPEPPVGFVVLGTVTPELVTPVMTELADGDTALSTAALVVAADLPTVASFPAVAFGVVETVTSADLVRWFRGHD